MTNEVTHSDDPEIDYIDASDSADTAHWADKFDSTPEQIQTAVAEVGNLAADVEMHLKGSRATTNADQEAKAEKPSNPEG